MNIFTVISSATAVFEQGKAIKGSTLLVNAEAGAAMLYGLFSALIVLLNALGIQVDIGGSDLHTVANGWSITISTIYAAYRVATNPVAGSKSAG